MKAFVKTGDDCWVFTEDPAAILDAETMMFVEPHELEREEKRYDGTPVMVNRDIPDIFFEKFMELKPDHTAIMYSEYKGIVENSRKGYWIGYSRGYNTINVKPINHEVISELFLSEVKYNIRSRDQQKEISQALVEYICKFSMDENAGKTIFTADDGWYTVPLRKAFTVPHKNLESMVLKFNDNNFHVNFKIETKRENSYPNYITKCEIKIEEDQIAAEHQRKAILKFQKSHTYKKVPRKRKEKPARINIDHLKIMSTVLQLLIKNFVEKYSYNHSGFNVVEYYRYQNGIRTARGWMGKVAMLYALQTQLPRASSERRRIKEWQDVMKVWRETTPERKKELHDSEHILNVLNEEARRTPRNLLTQKAAS